MSAKIKIIFHSLYGHTFRLAEAIADGASGVSGTSVELLQVAETLLDSVLEKMGALGARQAFAHVPVADAKKLPEADAIIFGSGTRFGSATSQMQAFFDATGALWSSGALVGKVGGVFYPRPASTAMVKQLINMQTFLFHQGDGGRVCMPRRNCRQHEGTL